MTTLENTLRKIKPNLWIVSKSMFENFIKKDKDFKEANIWEKLKYNCSESFKGTLLELDLFVDSNLEDEDLWLINKDKMLVANPNKEKLK